VITHGAEALAPPPRALVLGASGFVGRATLAALAAAGIEAAAPSRAELDLEAPDAATRLAALAKPGDALVFISALTPSRGRDLATLARNVRIGEQVAAFVERGGVAHAVYVGSDAVYADDANPVREESPRHPGSLHGLMHVTREGMLGYAAGRAGVPLAVLRPAALYGAGDPHNSYGPNRFLRTARSDGKIALFGGGEEKRDHVLVDDVARLVVTCLRRRSAGVLNVASGRAWSFHEVARLVADLVGAGVAIETSPRSGSVTHRHFDIAALHRAFPEFHPTALPDGLAHTVRAEMNQRRSS
jgi:nucleoside-diphosphate-sugar epimerase